MAEKRILVIDDDPDLVQALEVILQREGMASLAAYSGEQGLAMAKSEKPDLVILDIMMEGTDGFTVARQMAGSQELSGTPVIILSAVGEHAQDTSYAPQDAIRSLEAEDWFAKPVEPEALVARIKELLS